MQLPTDVQNSKKRGGKRAKTCQRITHFAPTGTYTGQHWLVPYLYLFYEGVFCFFFIKHAWILDWQGPVDIMQVLNEVTEKGYEKVPLYASHHFFFVFFNSKHNPKTLLIILISKMNNNNFKPVFFTYISFGTYILSVLCSEKISI